MADKGVEGGQQDEGREVGETLGKRERGEGKKDGKIK